MLDVRLFYPGAQPVAWSDKSLVLFGVYCVLDLRIWVDELVINPVVVEPHSVGSQCGQKHVHHWFANETAQMVLHRLFLYMNTKNLEELFDLSYIAKSVFVDIVLHPFTRRIVTHLDDCIEPLHRT
jgi:hypothetical protein